MAGVDGPYEIKVSQVLMIAHVGGGLAVFVGKKVDFVLLTFSTSTTRHSIDTPADAIDFEMRNQDQDQLPSGISRPIRRGI